MQEQRVVAVHTTQIVLRGLDPRDSRAEVDAILEAVRTAGGKADPCPKQDHGFMDGRSFEDLDGHVFEPMWMDVDAALAATGSQQAGPA